MAERNPLLDYWYPVALAASVRDKPVGLKLLDQDIVLWRAGGTVQAFADLCVHRGTRLSLGWVDGDQLVCPYHGWCYDREGAATRIPSIPADRPIPSQARTAKYHCAEKYGLVFVCLGEPKKPIIEFPEYEQDGVRIHHVGPVVFNADAARSFENYFDDTHFPWVHAGVLGDRDRVAPAPPRAISEGDGEFTYAAAETVAANRFDPNDTKTVPYQSERRIVPPFALYSHQITPGAPLYSKLFFSTPIAAKKTVRFMVAVTRADNPRPVEKLIEFTHKVWEQDRPIVEGQRPDLVPTDFAQELHLREPDGPSVVYRRMLRALGYESLSDI